MGWALLWAFILGSAATADKTGASAGFLAFIVVWYFAAKSDEAESVAEKALQKLRDNGLF